MLCGIERPVEFEVIRMEVDAHAVVSVAGELDMAAAPRLRGELMLAADLRPELLVVDLDAVTFIDAAGIGPLLTGARLVSEHGGRLTIACARRPVRRVLEMAGIDRYLGVHDSVADAVASCPSVTPGRG